MSLIQEALRRKEEESGGPDRIPPRVVLPMGDAPPAPKPADRPEGAKRRAMAWDVLVVLLAVGFLAMLAALGWFFYKFTPFLQSAKAPITEPHEIARTVGTVTPEEIARPPSATPPVAAPSLAPAAPDALAEPPASRKPATAKPAALVPDAAAPAMAERPAAPTAAPTRKEDRPAGMTAAAADSAASVAGRADVSVEKRVGDKAAAAVPEVKTVPVAVAAKTSAWPRLTLNGVMAQTGPGQGSAIINGTVVEIGEKIEGARLMEVQRNGVLLEYRGNTQFVRVGQSTF